MNILEAAQAIQTGEIVIVPTEGVYGLSCDPQSNLALHCLLRLKNRPADKGLILVASDVAQLDAYVDWDQLPRERCSAVMESWPGPFTWVVPIKSQVSLLISGQHRSVAVRVTDHPLMAELCRLCQSPLVSTSANLSGKPSVSEAAELDPELLHQVAGVVAGKTGGRIRPSLIRDALSGAVLR